MSIAYNTSIVRDGLVLHLDAANKKSYPGTGTTWFDLSGNGNNGTLTNGPTYNSSNGGNILFDGTDDIVIASTGSYINSRSLTFLCWLKTDTVITPADRRGICHGRNMPAGYLSFFGHTSGTNGTGTILFESRDSTNTTYSGVGSGQFNIYSTAWVMVGFQVAQSEVRCFYNNGSGLNVSTASDTRQGFTYDGVGLGRDGSSFDWKGNISSMMWYNTILTSSDLNRNFEALRGRYGI